MKPNDFDDSGVVAADRRDNRRAIVVATVAVVVVAIASGALMAGQQHEPQVAAPRPTPSSSGAPHIELPTAAFHGADDGDVGVDTPLWTPTRPAPRGHGKLAD
jgi:hypothetical protein